MSDTPETDKEWRHPASFDGSERVVHISVAQKRERERDEARDMLKALGATVYEGLRLAALRVKSERDEAREERDHWKTEYEIVVARLCGKKHARDNGIFSEHEIIPKLTQERDEARAERDILRSNKMSDPLLETTFKHLNRERDEACQVANGLAKQAERLRKERDQLKEALLIMENLLKPGIELFPEIGEILKQGGAK